LIGFECNDKRDLICKRNSKKSALDGIWIFQNERYGSRRRKGFSGVMLNSMDFEASVIKI